MPDLTPAQAEAKRFAAFYKARGWDALPSDPRPSAEGGKKKPLCRFKEYWDTPTPDDLFDRFPTTNIQLICGTRTGFIVLDADGIEGRTILAQSFHGKPNPPTWITHSGGGGRHHIYRLPKGWTRPMPKALLWGRWDEEENKWVKHQAIERLCDRSLVVAPPSIHPETRQKYRFLDDAHSPKRLGVPAICPDWILNWEPVHAPRAEPEYTAPPTVRFPAPAVASGESYRAANVLAWIPDKIALAQSWGLRVTGNANGADEWVTCRAINREDRVPSASIHRDSGYYVDHGQNATFSLFGLAAELGAYADWREAVQDLGSRYVPRRHSA